VGIVVPRAYYLGRLSTIRDRLLAVSLGIMALLILGGTFILRRVKRGLAQIVGESLTMNAFEFSPAPTGSSFRDVSEVLESLEKTKTAMRAMSKYVPVDLVRRLYRSKTEPVLGSELMEISIMFTDIKDFTTSAEQITPNELAVALGRYLDVMVSIIQQETGGTIDKFIGDAIMTFWNAPARVAEHARMACLAALRCREASHALSQSSDWQGLPPFETRFGLHQGKALVGHFGAHDRMNYTAMGDAVNLASRLEGLNKQYGTSILASDRIVENARAHFDFRLLDLVAVKGKTDAVKIYELLGHKGAGSAMREKVRVYEAAFEAYVARKFGEAIAILAQNDNDPPSAILLNRCRAFQEAPPPVDWQGVHVSTSK
jgi:adenylate cyclase